MRAVRHQSWGSEAKLVDVPAPEPAAGEVRIAVKATSVNPIDIHTSRNAGYEQSMRLPYTPGWDVAGVVDRVGYGVTRHAVGDSVYGLPLFPYPAGTYAQYVTVPAFQVVAMPASASYVQAGCLPMAALTARQMLDAGEVVAGQRVLISGASGGVGHMAVQLAAHRGAHIVALARPVHHSMVRELGANDCVDYTDPIAIEAAGQFDAVIDFVGHQLGAAILQRVRPAGTMVLATAWSIPDYRAIADRQGIRAASHLVEPDPAGLDAIVDLFEIGALRPVIGATFDLSRVVDAQQWVVGRGGFGKAALLVD